jgi:hypothetical protein
MSIIDRAVDGAFTWSVVCLPTGASLGSAASVLEDVDAVTGGTLRDGFSRTSVTGTARRTGIRIVAVKGFSPGKTTAPGAGIAVTFKGRE